MLLHDSPTDHFRDLRDDGISEGFNSVHPGGNPMNVSAPSGLTATFQSLNLSSEGKSKPLFEVCRIAFVRSGLAPHRKSLAHRVGNNPDSIPVMFCAKVGSRNAMPFRVIPERGQVSDNTSKSSAKESRDVLHKDIARSYIANQSNDLRPQA